MKRASAVLSLFLAFATLAFAHGNEKHIMGTVASVTADSVTVETTEKKSVTVNITANTEFDKSGTSASLQDLKVGDKVVIHADQSGGKLNDTHIRFGATNQKSSMPGMKGMEHGM